MRLVLGLVIAVSVAGALAGCGETEDATMSESPTGTTPTASPTTRPTMAGTVTSSPAGSAAPSPTPSSTTEGLELVEYADPDYGVALQYPRGWAVRQIEVDATLASHDVSGAVEFAAKGGLARASIYTYSNSSDLPLEDWILDHNALFFEDPPVDMTIAGLRGLLAPLNFDGRASPLAYLKSGLLVYGIKGATDEDFQVIAWTFAPHDR